MSCCHHLVQIDGELLGDPLEVEMVQYSGYTLIFEDSYFKACFGKQSLKVIHIFEFTSEE